MRLFFSIFVLWAKVPLPLNCWIAKRMSGIAFIYESQPPSRKIDMKCPCIDSSFFFVRFSFIVIHFAFRRKRAPRNKKNQRNFPIYTKFDIMSHRTWYEKSYNDAYHWFRTGHKKWIEAKKKGNLWLIIPGKWWIGIFLFDGTKTTSSMHIRGLIEFNRHFLWPWDVRYLMSYWTMDIEYSCNGVQWSHSHPDRLQRERERERVSRCECQCTIASDFNSSHQWSGIEPTTKKLNHIQRAYISKNKCSPIYRRISESVQFFV